MRNTEGRRSSVLLKLLDIVMALLSTIAILTISLVILGGSLSPESWWIPAFVILGAPIVYCLNILVLIYWILRWDLVGIFSVGIFMAIAIWGLGAFVQVRVWKSYKNDERRDLKVLSYNIHSLNIAGVPYGQSLNNIVSFVKSEDPDVICFQEFQSLTNDTTGVIVNAFAQWPYFASLFGQENPSLGSGSVIFSKYPISPCNSVINEGTTGGVLGVDLYADGDTVRLYNCHLQTTAYNQVNQEQPLGQVLAQDDAASKFRLTASVMRGNFVLRAAQADSLALLTAHSPYPLVVVGDLNSVPLSYTYKTVRGDLSDAFRDRGEGYGYTYRPMKGILRIDYAFYDDYHYECSDYRSPNLEYSDHNPVIVTLKKKR